MKYPKQDKTCECCEGYGRVAVLVKGPQIFAHIIGKPMPMTFAKARQTLMNYRGRPGALLPVLVRKMSQNLDTHPCPWCDATGIEYSLRQLTVEEAAVFRAQEESASSKHGDSRE